MLFEPAAVGIVDIDDGHAIGRQRGIDRALGHRHAEQAAHAFQVRRSDVVDQRIARAGDVGQVGDVARLAGAHLVDGVVGIFRGIDHRQRQADLVVAVARVGVDHLVRVLGHLLQDRQQQALDAGLAVAAGDREHLGVAVALHAGGNPGQGQFAVSHQHLRHIQRQQALDQQRARATRLRIGGEVMAVETLAAQGHVQGAGAQAAGVIADRIDGHVVAVDLATGPVRDQRKQGALHAMPFPACGPSSASCGRATSASMRVAASTPALAASAAAETSVSSKSWRTPLTSW